MFEARELQHEARARGDRRVLHGELRNGEGNRIRAGVPRARGRRLRRLRRRRARPAAAAARCRPGAPPPAPGAPPPVTVDRAVSVQAFSQTVYPIVREHCADCHAGAGPGSPSIAHPNVDTAFTAIVNSQKVNLTTPNRSRLVRRLIADFHYCWSDCMLDGMQMEAAIAAWAEAVALAAPPPGTGGSPGSGARGRPDREQRAQARRRPGGSRGGALPRASDRVLRLQGRHRHRRARHQRRRARDGPHAHGRALDVELRDRDRDGQGERHATREPQALRPHRGRADRHAAVLGRGLGDPGQHHPGRPGAHHQPTRRTAARRNFHLGQTLYSYDVRNRSVLPAIDGNGKPALITYPADQDLQATLQHVVVTYDQYRGRRIYVNGVFTDDVDEQGPGRLWNWESEPHLRAGQRSEQRPPLARQAPAGRDLRPRAHPGADRAELRRRRRQAPDHALRRERLGGRRELHRVHGQRARRLQLPVLPADLREPERHRLPRREPARSP